MIYSLYKGTYLVVGTEKKILIDGVDASDSEEYIKRIEQYFPIEEIDGIVFNNGSPENAECLLRLLEKNKTLDVYASTAGLKNISEIINADFTEKVCKNNGRLPVGDGVLVFRLIPGAPWPDSMVTYYEDEKILFSGRSGDTDVFETALKYGNGMVKSLGSLCIDYIYNRDGITENNGDIFKDISVDADEGPDIVVVYSSEYGYTREMAKKIADTASENGYKAEICKAENVSGDLMMKAKSLALGTHTENRSMPGDVWKFLSQLRVSDVSGKYYFVFGSSGWSGEGIHMSDMILSELRMRKSDKPFEVTFRPCVNDMNDLSEYTLEFLKKVIL